MENVKNGADEVKWTFFIPKLSKYKQSLHTLISTMI